MISKTYRIAFIEAALRDIKKLTRQAQKQVVDKIQELSIEPRPDGIESLTGYKGLFRVRTGNFRIVYTINDEEVEVLVVAVADRKEVYEIIERRFK